MKRGISIIAGLVLATVCVPALLAQSAAPHRDRASALYESADRALEAKDLPGYMSLFAPDYEQILVGKNREGLRGIIKDIFDGYGALRSRHTLLDITQSGGWIKAVVDIKIEGRTRRNDWETVSQETRVDLLAMESGDLRFARSTPTDRRRLANVNGRTYADDQSGLSF